MATLLGFGQYEALISPFLGSGALELASNAKVKIVADADFALNQQWQFILREEWPQVIGGLKFWQKQVADLVATPSYAAYASLTPRRRRIEAVDNPLAMSFLVEMDSIWDRLLALREGLTDALQVAIAALAIRKLAFGAVVRQGKGGQLNIKWALDNLAAFVNFSGAQPYIKGVWHLHGDCFDAIAAFKSAGYGPAIAVVDPPYWLPWEDGVRNQMDPAYPGHTPHSDETFRLGVDSVRQLAQCGNIKRIAYCNYFSEQMDVEIREIARSAGLSIQTKALGILDGMQRGHGCIRQGNMDYAWILQRN